MTKLVHYAAKYGNLDLFIHLLFLNKKYDVFTVDLAAKYGNINILQCIYYIDDNISVSEYGFDEACYYGHINVIDFLLNTKRYSYNKAITFASQNNHINILKLLVINRVHILADLNQAIDVAAINEHINIVYYLYTLGARLSENVIEKIISKKNKKLIHFLVKTNEITRKNLILVKIKIALFL